MTSIINFLQRSSLVLLILIGVASISFGGGIRNKGQITNPAGGSITATTILNAVGSVGGIIRNGGSITVNGANGSFYSYDTVGGIGTGAGTFYNYFGGQGPGTLSTPILYNASGSTIGSVFNDSTAAANSGVINLTGYSAIVNPGGASNFHTQVGTVNFSSAGTQPITDQVNGSTYGVLETSNGGTKQVASGATNVFVNSTLNLGAGTTLDENGKTLTLNGTVSGTGLLLASGVGSTTVYNQSGGTQSVLSTSYYNLQIANAGGGTKQAAGAITVGTASAGALTVATSNTFDLATYQLTVQPTTGNPISNSGTIQTANTATPFSFGSATYQIGGTVIYYANAGTQPVASADYANLTLQNAGTRTFGGTIGIGGIYTVAGTRTYTGGTVNYNGSATFGSLAQTIVGGESYNNLGVSGGAAIGDTATHKIVSGASLSVAGTLTLAANTSLDMAASTGSFGVGSTMQASSKILWQGNNAYLAGGVTEFYGGTSANVAAGSGYGEILFTGNGAKTIPASTAVTATGVYVYNNLSLAALGQLTVNGDLNNDGTVTNAGTITVN